MRNLYRIRTDGTVLMVVVTEITDVRKLFDTVKLHSEIYQ